MKSMKKLVSLALCTAMLGSTIPGMNIAAAETTGKTEFWNDKMANTDQSKLDQMQESIKDLSGIDVELIAYPDTASYQTAMQQSIRTEDAPGLFTWWSGSQLETLVKEGLVEDMTDFWDEYVIPNGVSADVADSLTFDGKIYGVPYSIIYNTIIYNKDIFNQYGLEEPQTFDEFLTVCQTLLDNGVTPIALKSDSWAGFIWFQAMLAAYDPALYEGICDGSIAYTDEKVVEVMNQWKDMLDKGYFSAPMTNVDMAKSVATGSVAMELEPNYEATTIVNDYGLDSKEDLGTFVLPSVDGAKKIKSGNCPTQTLVDAYEMKNGGEPNQKDPYTGRDPRFAMTIAVNGDKWPNTNPNPLEIYTGGRDAAPVPYATPTGYYVKKYVDGATDISASTSSGGKRHSWITFRLGEFLLNYAEATFKYFGSADIKDAELTMTAREAVNKVRKRTGVDMPDFPEGMSSSDFWSRYKNERMVELAFEGHRFWDVRRWKEGGFTSIGRMLITKNSDDSFTYTRSIKALVWDDKMYFYPIPDSEIRKNPNLKQNPGWDK